MKAESNEDRKIKKRKLGTREIEETDRKEAGMCKWKAIKRWTQTQWGLAKKYNSKKIEKSWYRSTIKWVEFGRQRHIKK